MRHGMKALALVALLAGPMSTMAGPVITGASYTIDKADCCTEYSVGVNVDVVGDAPVTGVTVSHVPIASGTVGTWALSQLGPTWWWNWSPLRPLFTTGPLDGTFVITATDSLGNSITSSALSIPAGSELDFPTMTMSITQAGYVIKAAPVANADYYSLLVAGDIEGYVYWQTVYDPAELQPIPFNKLTVGRRYWVYWMAVNVIPTGTLDSVFRSYDIRQIVHASPDALLKQLAADVAGVGSGKSLANKVTLAQTYYEVPDVQATCAVLTDFVREVKAQAAKKKLTATQAATLTSDANAIMAALGCN